MNSRRRKAHVELTEDSVRIDGMDISNQVTDVLVEIGADRFPRVTIISAPWLVTFSGDAQVIDAPLDGIARLRERFAK